MRSTQPYMPRNDHRSSGTGNYFPGNQNNDSYRPSSSSGRHHHDSGSRRNDYDRSGGYDRRQEEKINKLAAECGVDPKMLQLAKMMSQSSNNGY